MLEFDAGSIESARFWMTTLQLKCLASAGRLTMKGTAGSGLVSRTHSFSCHMIACRHADRQYPFLQEATSTQAGRWHDVGELTHYFADTPDWVWAEFLRHEDIDDPLDVLTIRRAIWAVEIGEPPSLYPNLPRAFLTGDDAEHLNLCRRFAQKARNTAEGLGAPSAALKSGGTHDWRVDGGIKSGSLRDGLIIVLFCPQPDLVGWAATIEGRPSE